MRLWRGKLSVRARVCAYKQASGSSDVAVSVHGGGETGCLLGGLPRGHRVHGGHPPASSRGWGRYPDWESTLEGGGSQNRVQEESLVPEATPASSLGRKSPQGAVLALRSEAGF